ncbi:MAG: class I tRNA ligase family protein, partial [Deltaproteobacteria bacterium]|nr:class I tRNA ligase family protein [Deltaproteobacteria bacterium]
VVREASESFENFDYAGALQISEEMFWTFCDHYLELVKVRSYAEEDSEGRRSALATLAWSLKTFIRLFAPILPYITDEIWSWTFAGAGKDAGSSVHVAAWPSLEEVLAVKFPPFSNSFDAAVEVIGQIRGAKTDAKKSLRWPVAELTITASGPMLEALSACLPDVLKAGNVTSHRLEQSSEESSVITVKVVLADS